MEQDTAQRRRELKREVDALRDRFHDLHQHERELLKQIEAMEVLADRLPNRLFKVALVDTYTYIVRSGTTLASAHLDTMISPTVFEGKPDHSSPEQKDGKEQQ